MRATCAGLAVAAAFGVALAVSFGGYALGRLLGWVQGFYEEVD